MTKTENKTVKKMVDEKMRLINRSLEKDAKGDELKKKIKKLPIEQRRELAKFMQIVFFAFEKAKKNGDAIRSCGDLATALPFFYGKLGKAIKGEIVTALPTNKIVVKIINEEIKILNRMSKDNEEMDELKKKIKKLPVELRKEVGQAEQLAIAEHFKK